MRPHGRFAHCSCKNAVRQPPVLASRVEIYYFAQFIDEDIFSNFHLSQLSCCADEDNETLRRDSSLTMQPECCDKSKVEKYFHG